MLRQQIIILAERDGRPVAKAGTNARGFAVDPHNSDVVYAAGEISSWEWAGRSITGREFDRVKGVVYKTTDGGQSWKRIWQGDNLARYVWIDSRDTDVLYVSTGIFDREGDLSLGSRQDQRWRGKPSQPCNARLDTFCGDHDRGGDLPLPVRHLPLFVAHQHDLAAGFGLPLLLRLRSRCPARQLHHSKQRLLQLADQLEDPISE